MKKKFLNEDSLRDLLLYNICIIGVPQGEESKKFKTYLKKYLKTSLIWGRKKDIQVWELQTIPNNMNPKRPTPRHIIITMANIKKRDSFFKTPHLRIFFSLSLEREERRERKTWM